MRRYFRFLVFFLLSLIFSAQTAFACRFNVRETGFVDFYGEQYLLIAYIDNNTPPETIDILHSTAQKMLSESNVIFEFINIEKQENHPALSYISNKKLSSLPTLLLISPEGQSLEFPLESSKQKFKSSLTKAINKILYSPTRKELQKQTVNTYGAILLIEGKNKEENTAARQEVQEALTNITKKMDLMPKLIKNPPSIVTLKYVDRFREPVLFWSLGLDTSKMGPPYAAIFYGRARWLGPLFKGKEISKQNLSEILFIVGADCECGLDKNWLRGTALPMMWNKKTSKRIAQNLGFDPENPLTKIEISQIMRLGRYTSNESLRHPSASFKQNTSNDSFPKSANSIAAAKPPFNDDHLDSLQHQEKQTIKKSIIITVSILGFLLIFGLIIIKKHYNKL